MATQDVRPFAETWGSVNFGGGALPVRRIVLWLFVGTWVVLTMVHTGTQGIIALSLNLAFILAVIVASKGVRTVSLRRVGLAFLCGGAVLGGVILACYGFAADVNPSSLMRTFFVPVLEEVAKILPVAFFLIRGRNFTAWTIGATDVLLLSAASGAGFA